MKLLEALAESNFKIYTNYECNYELILQILSYYNVIAEILVKKGFIKKKKINNNSKHSNFDAHTKLLYAHTKLLFPTNVAASIETFPNKCCCIHWNGEQWFFWNAKLEKWAKVAERGNSGNY